MNNKNKIEINKNKKAINKDKIAINKNKSKGLVKSKKEADKNKLIKVKI